MQRARPSERRRTIDEGTEGGERGKRTKRDETGDRGRGGTSREQTTAAILHVNGISKGIYATATSVPSSMTGTSLRRDALCIAMRYVFDSRYFYMVNDCWFRAGYTISMSYRWSRFLMCYGRYRGYNDPAVCFCNDIILVE